MVPNATTSATLPTGDSGDEPAGETFGECGDNCFFSLPEDRPLACKECANNEQCPNDERQHCVTYYESGTTCAAAAAICAAAFYGPACQRCAADCPDLCPGN
jgi:hypothetical protein